MFSLFFFIIFFKILFGSNSLTTALSVARQLQTIEPIFEFQRLQGACRTAEDTPGMFRTLQGISRSVCEAECVNDNDCVAYEYNQFQSCEIHSEAITQTAEGFGDVTCDIKIYKQLEGACRTIDDRVGTFRTIQGITRVDCMLECSNDLECVAYEYNQFQSCEIHSEMITQTAEGFGGVTCDIKLTFGIKPQTPLILCSAEVRECPGAAGFFVSRDPAINCDFNFDECPQVQPRPQVQLLDGFCRTAQGGSGRPTVRELDLTDCEAECLALGSGCTAYEWTATTRRCELHQLEIVRAEDNRNSRDMGVICNIFAGQ